VTCKLGPMSRSHAMSPPRSIVFLLCCGSVYASGLPGNSIYLRNTERVVGSEPTAMPVVSPSPQPSEPAHSPSLTLRPTSAPTCAPVGVAPTASYETHQPAAYCVIKSVNDIFGFSFCVLLLLCVMWRCWQARHDPKLLCAGGEVPITRSGNNSDGRGTYTQVCCCCCCCCSIDRSSCPFCLSWIIRDLFFLFYLDLFQSAYFDRSSLTCYSNLL
jgi:hypothetical protein